jgi:hypothetical protein
MRTVQTDMSDVARTLLAAMAALERNDLAAADFLLVSAQAALGRIHERFAPPPLEPQQNALRVASAEIGALRETARENPEDAKTMLTLVYAKLPALTVNLDAHRRASLYDVSTLTEALMKAH